MQEATPNRVRIAHVGIAIPSLSAATAFYRDVLGMDPVELSDSDGARIEAFQAGESLVELLEPDGADTPIGKFIAKRGLGHPPYLLCRGRPRCDAGALQGEGDSADR